MEETNTQSLEDLLSTVPIYCISLKDNESRRNDVKTRIRSLLGDKRASEIKFHIVDANKTSAILGCLESHCDVVEEAMKLGYDSVMILEDDVILTSDFIPIIDKMPKQWDMIYLGYNVYNGYRYNKSLLKVVDAKTTHAYILSGNCFKQISKNARQSGIPIDDYYTKFIQTNRNCYGVYPMIFSQADGFSTTEGRETKYCKSMIARSIQCASMCSTNICREVVFLTPPSEKQWKNSTLIQLVKKYTKIVINTANDYDYVIVHEKGCTYKHKKTIRDMEIISKNLIKTSGWDIIVLSDVGLPKKVYAVRKMVWDMVDMWKSAKITYVYPPLYGIDENEIKNVEPKSVGTYPLHIEKHSSILHKFFLYRNIYVFATTNLTLVKNITALIKHIVNQSNRDEVKNSVFFVCAPFDYIYRKTQFDNIFLINHTIYNHVPPHIMIACDFNCFITIKITDYCKKIIYWSSKITNGSNPTESYSDNIISHIGTKISSIVRFKTNKTVNKPKVAKETLIEIPHHSYNTIFKSINLNRLKITINVWDDTFFINDSKYIEDCPVVLENGKPGINFSEVIVCKADDLTDDIYWHCMNAQCLLFVTTQDFKREYCITDIEEFKTLLDNKKMLNLYRMDICKYVKKYSWNNMVKTWDSLL